MTWFRVDDVLTFHPRVIRAGNAAMGLWVRAGAWCSEHLTDGWIAHEDARTMGSAAEIKKLVTVGLWFEQEHAGERGYQFHRWTTNGVGDKRNPTRAEIEARRDADRKRKAAAGQRGASSRWNPVGVQSDSERNDSGVQSDSERLPMAPVPSRPVPSPPNGGSAQARPTARARSIPDDFVISPAMRAWAEERVPELDIDATLEEFTSYWAGTGKAMKDWEATWRNGMLKSDQRGDHRRKQPSRRPFVPVEWDPEAS